MTVRVLLLFQSLECETNMFFFSSSRGPILFLRLSLIPLTVIGCGRSDSPSETKSATTAASSADTNQPAATKPARESWPTEEEAKAAIFKVEYRINASETNKSVWKVKDFRHEVKSVKFAQKTIQKHYYQLMVKLCCNEMLNTSVHLV